MNIRESMEQREQKMLSPYAALSLCSRGRERQEEECDVRTVYQRDRDRILHSKAFRRMKDKTQVFVAPQGDHYRTRLTHTLEVSQIARTIAKALRLNEDLVEAIALGHDLGHTPFGHAGERALDAVNPDGFAHYKQSVRVAQVLEKNGEGLNLTWEVRDGILNHRTSGNPSTLEGQVVRLSDKIAYIHHDMDDAQRAGIISEDDIPVTLRMLLGYTTRERLNTFVHDVIENSLEQDTIKMSAEIYEALKHLADRAGVQLPKIEYSGEAKKKAERRAALLEINKLAAGYFYYQLRRESGRQAHEYLTGRGLSEETIRKFGLGYSDKYSDDLYKYLKSKNYSDELLRDSGLFNVDERRGMYDKFWNRVIFPIMDVNNRVIGFGGRVMGDGKPKYLNSPETTIFDKSRNLYGLNVARTTRKNYLILCEGYMDVISMHQAGFTNAVASLGTALTSGHASLLKRYTQEVLLLYDSDDAGVRAALRAIPILREAGVSSRVVNLKPHKDPDEFIKALGAEEFEKRLEQAMDSFMFRIHMAEREFPMEEPQGQNRFFERCAQMLLELSDELERNLYIEAIVKDYRSSGISVENLKKRVGALAMKGTPAEQRIQPKPVGAGQQKKKESAAEKAQKLMLTWLVTYPGIFDTVEKYIQPSDFVVPLYRQVAEMLYQQHRDGDVNPARLMNAFIDSEEQREVSSLFNATIHLETPEEQNRAFSDAVIRIKDESLKERNRTWDPTDIQGLQELVKAKKELEELGRKRQQLHISFE